MRALRTARDDLAPGCADPHPTPANLWAACSPDQRHLERLRYGMVQPANRLPGSQETWGLWVSRRRCPAFRFVL